MLECLGRVVTTICGRDTLQQAKEDDDKGGLVSKTTTAEKLGSASPSLETKYSFEVPPMPVCTDPIVLETLQGDWFNSNGAKINVNGTKVTLNGHLMEMHPVKLNDDGTVQCIGSIWQLWGWAPGEGGKLEFKEAPNYEAGRYGRSVYWNKMVGEESKKQWEQHMTNLGYAGSALCDLSKRGVEGCRPGSCDAFQSKGDSGTLGEEDVSILSDSIHKWRQRGLHLIKPALAIPDFSNRCHTGISVEHMHYLANSFLTKGFQKRNNDTHMGHDIPVVVMETPTSELGRKSIENWRSKVREDDGFPPMAHYEKVFQQPTLYTTLGNGHFFQALNLVANGCKPINQTGASEYSVGHDALLAEAINEGVPSIVLQGEIPLETRQLISRMLNSKREYRWKMSRTGSFLGLEEDTSQVSQFVAMSKVLDAVELNCLVRAELRITEGGRIGK
eukprot:GEMP01019722.1.p1 GENE.GEMP01019722.1~~GEMP01019722.1.p1  ORF type:complete len:445 (+),score=93.19 GEMP01019722.1:123-1457(+)